MRSVLNFKFPPKLPFSQQVIFAKRIVAKYQFEAKVLRKEAATLKTLINRLEKEAEKWRGRYDKSQEELKITKEEIGKAKEAIGKLKKEIGRLTKTNRRYQISLFDHGNFKSPDESLDKKPKGGQLGHSDTNRENQNLRIIKGLN